MPDLFTNKDRPMFFVTSRHFENPADVRQQFEKATLAELQVIETELAELRDAIKADKHGAGNSLFGRTTAIHAQIVNEIREREKD